VCEEIEHAEKKQEECLDISCNFNDLEEKSARGLYRDNN
jgi:hypothetical protein